MMNYTVMEYIYRDADNYKAHGQLLLQGQVTEEKLATFRSYLEDGEFFVAEQVGVPVLYEQLWQYSNGPTKADHAYHEFLAIRPASFDEIDTGTIWGSVTDLVDRFRGVENHWDCRYSVHCEL